MNKSIEMLEDKMSTDKYEFELIYDGDDTYFYQCRGGMHYDDDHDEVPEPALWSDANALAELLEDEGYTTSVAYSEKGWVEVYVSIW
jgi:phage terminase large subunit-like protein